MEVIKSWLYVSFILRCKITDNVFWILFGIEIDTCLMHMSFNIYNSIRLTGCHIWHPVHSTSSRFLLSKLKLYCVINYCNNTYHNHTSSRKSWWSLNTVTLFTLHQYTISNYFRVFLTSVSLPVVLVVRYHLFLPVLNVF